MWRRFTRSLPTTLALTGVTAVWAAGAVWSFEEQTRYATSRGFTLPWLLPLVLDGLALSLAALAYAAALDGRAAVLARLGTLLAVAASAASNGAWAWTRTAAQAVAESTTVMPGTPTGGMSTTLAVTHTAAAGAPDVGTVVLAAGVPIAANLAFEVLLSELRRQVQRRRGMPAPVAIPWPRLVRWVLAPWPTFVAWRRLVLDLTALRAPVHDARPDRAPHDVTDVHDAPEDRAQHDADAVHQVVNGARRDDAPVDAVAMRRASRSARTGASRRARTSTRDRVLAARRRYPEASGAELARQLGVNPSTVTRHLSAVEAR